MRTALYDMFGIKHPLVAFSRWPAVVAEVSRAGGLGVLAATPYTPDELDGQLAWIAEQAGGAPFGVDLLVPRTMREPGPVAPLPDHQVAFVRDLLNRHRVGAEELGQLGHADTTTRSLTSTGVEQILDVAFCHRPALVANALGPAPASLVARARRGGVAVAALVGSADHARRQLDVGVDLLVAQGTEAGGHTGTVATMVLTPDVVDVAGPVPVLAAGGIADGRQLAAALALGAAGAWCGSVWLASIEDGTSPAIKRRLLAASSTDTVRSTSRTGKPARQLRSAWHDAWEQPDAPEPLPMPQQLRLSKDAWALIDRAVDSGNDEAQALISFFIGQVVGRMCELRPAARIVDAMVAECRRVLDGLR